MSVAVHLSFFSNNPDNRQGLLSIYLVQTRVVLDTTGYSTEGLIVPSEVYAQQLLFLTTTTFAVPHYTSGVATIENSQTRDVIQIIISTTPRIVLRIDYFRISSTILTIACTIEYIRGTQFCRSWVQKLSPEVDSMWFLPVIGWLVCPKNRPSTWKSNFFESTSGKSPGPFLGPGLFPDLDSRSWLVTRHRSHQTTQTMALRCDFRLMGLPLSTY